MEFIFELFAELLGKNESADKCTSEKEQAAAREKMRMQALEDGAADLMRCEEQESAEAEREEETESVNIFSFVNFH